jgi:endonuclease III
MSNGSIRDLLLQRGEELFHAPAQVRHFTNNSGADTLLNDLDKYPHAFVLACVMDRQVKAERAWLIPYLFSEKIGGFEFARLRSLSLAQVRELMSKPVPLHRFPERMSENFYDAIRLIGESYAGDAAKIWQGQPSSAEVVYRFLQFRGIGPKIATMATNILAREFKIPLSDYYSVDISADVHVRRVFSRLGLVRADASIDELIYVARSLNPEFPGLLDLPAWDIGRKWCRPQIPLCTSCYMQEQCPASKTITKSDPGAKAD